MQKERSLEVDSQNWNINITGRHIQLTDAMKEHALERISRIEKFLDNVIDIHIVMTNQKNDHIVDIILKFSSMKIASKAVCHDMYTAIDEAVRKIEVQIRKYKSKIQDHHTRRHLHEEMRVKILQLNATASDQPEIHEAESEHSIIAQKTLPLKKLTHHEAVMKMELSQDNFLIFMDQNDSKLKVIYRREDNQYGIIEPKY